MHAPGRQPVLPYPVAAPHAAAPVPMAVVAARLEALAHPELTAPEVSRHLAVLRRAGLLTAGRRGRYVPYELDSGVTASLGADLLEAVLR
ncbi:ArsR/SmtB family transcription factor [Streptacidiphilus jiangxiensis]|uniref:ArsR family transcriptional regulator n=1 Tax=Streptacidiphilus jiangxiensis TaxID=235985 RepID=A0A1H7VB48_STRJI|nr:hypothetical protein SAMN05414137_117192 [Streptacidiphilus jiangxiensis]